MPVNPSKSRKEVIELIYKTFKNPFAKDSEEFSSGMHELIWSTSTMQGSDYLPILGYWENWEHPEFKAFLDEVGWWFEWHDPETIILLPHDLDVMDHLRAIDSGLLP